MVADDANPPLTDVEVEMALLGTLMIDRAAFDEASQHLTAESFADDAHKRIYAAIADRRMDGRDASVLLLQKQFATDGILRDLGGSKYLAEIVAGAAAPVDAADYARHLADLALRRTAISRADTLSKAMLDGVGDSWATKIAAEHIAALDDDIRQAGGGGRQAKPLGDAILEALEHAREREGQEGVTTGIDALDRVIGSLAPGQVWTIAGRTGMGKSVMAQTIARNVARRGKRVLFVALEMSAEDIATRMVAGEAKIPAKDILAGKVKGYDFGLLMQAYERLKELPLILDDDVDACTAVETLAPRVRARHEREPIHLIIIDYVQLMESMTVQQHGGSEVAELTRITKALKRLARSLNVPLIQLAQINRGVESRENKRPTLADLRGSGTIEQDSDGILLLYREVYYLEKAGEPRDSAVAHREWMDKRDQLMHRAEVIVGKNRFGEGRTVYVGFDGFKSEFYDAPLDDDYSTPGAA